MYRVIDMISVHMHTCFGLCAFGLHHALHTPSTQRCPKIQVYVVCRECRVAKPGECSQTHSPPLCSSCTGAGIRTLQSAARKLGDWACGVCVSWDIGL